MNKKDITVVICCAGMGTRLGIGSTKALVSIGGKPLILHQLELLKDFDDIRIVVGFQAEKVINTVINYRKDIMFAFNYSYQTTGVAASLCKGLSGCRKYVMCMDGDLLINKNDFKTFLEYEGECLAISSINSDEPVLVEVNNKKAVSFSQKGDFCWSGLAKIESDKLRPIDSHVYEMIQSLLPIDVVIIRSREIDTQDDYERAIEWVRKGCMED